VISFTDWAKDILTRSQEAATRFNPDARIRLMRTPSGVQALLTDRTEPDDEPLRIGAMTLYVESGLEGLIDVEEPHDRLVLRPAGSTPNLREGH
jgi:hypothetical protein